MHNYGARMISLRCHPRKALRFFSTERVVSEIFTPPALGAFGGGGEVEGWTAAGWESVRTAFESNFAAKEEVGAQLCIFHKGKPVVDLSGKSDMAPADYDAGTLQCVFSSGKNMEAIAVAMLVSRGQLAYDATVSSVWPEYGSGGKGEVTIADVMRHEGGVPYLANPSAPFDAAQDEVLTPEDVRDVDSMERKIERAVREPRRVYHAITRGFVVNGILRRVDPAGRSLGRFIAEEISAPLGVDYYCGIPEAEQQRLLALHAADVRAATRASGVGWGARADEQLVAWANAAAEQLEVDHPTPLLRRGAAAPPGRWLDIDPRDVVLRKDDRMRLQLIASHSAPSRAFRFAVLKLLNRRLKRVLPLLDVGSTQRWRVGHKLRRMGHCIFLDLKRRLLDDALERTLGRQRRAHDLNLDHSLKLQSQDRGDTAPAASKCLFAQVFAQTRGIAPDTFRRSSADSRSQAFHVRFKNESGIDAGGVYRETLTEIVDDLHGAEFSLFLLCPNGQHAYPTNANKYVPHPAFTTALALEMLELVGKVMGLSLRQKATLPFQLPSIVWRALLGQPCNREDLRAVDTMCVQLLERIEAMATAAAFAELTAELEGGLRFSAVGSDAKAVELKPVRANAPMLQCCPPAHLRHSFHVLTRHPSHPTAPAPTHALALFARRAAPPFR